ncbi:MAG TPA: GntR family transcriptional regulator [Burkholderiales bacterium]|jgi:DNA-binding GntR family transcriptional regulator
MKKGLAKAHAAPSIDAALPQRYWEYADTLRNQITAGEFAVGDKLPTEEELCARFGCTRYTIREALKVLTEEGLIARRPRAGSVVIATEAASHFTQSVGSVAQLLNYTDVTIRHTLAADYIKADHELAALLQCAPGATWFRIQALRFMKGATTPFCHTTIYFLPEFAGVMKHKRHLQIPVAEQIAEMFGVHPDDTQIDISASEIPDTLAGLLKVKKGSPALSLVRRYADAAGRVYEVAIGLHAAQRYTYSFHLKRKPVKGETAAVKKRRGSPPA